MKLLIAVQFWEGDRDDAMELAKLIAWLEQTPRDDVDFLFSHRFDCRPPANDVVEYVQKSFKNVFVMQGKRQDTGWPDGCNALWLETVNLACVQGRSVHHWDAVLTLEGDDVPMRKDWLDILKNEWQKHSDVWVLGHYIDDPNMPHINGNLLVTPNLPLLIPQLNNVPKWQAWDTYHWPKFKDHAKDSEFVFSQRWKDKITFDELVMRRNPLVPLAYRHGIKDPSVKDIVKRILSVINVMPESHQEAEGIYRSTFK